MKETKHGNGFLRSLHSLITLKEPSSVISEQYRILLSSLLQMQKTRPFKTIGITSAIQGEGKTTIAFNLAITMTKIFKKRTLLMETDVKKPSFLNLIVSRSSSGLLDALRGKEDPLMLLQYTLEDQLAILPSGVVGHHVNEILVLERIQAVVDRLRDHFEIIIIDACPVLPLADMNILSEVMDGIVFVVEAGRTPRSNVSKAISQLPPEKILGLVLNNTKTIPSFSYSYSTPYQY